MRADGRRADELRRVEILPGFVETASGSALISVGRTRVICTASIDENVPAWMRGRGKGWVTAEYGMLPASTGERKARDVAKGRPDGRTTEIQRLIGRSLRAVVYMEALGERTVWLDCDVLQADGGTRTPSITGACVALTGARTGLAESWGPPPSGNRLVAAVTVGMVGEEVLLDLAYVEDCRRSDANVRHWRRAPGRGAGHRRRGRPSPAPSSTRCSTMPRSASGS